MLKDQLIWTACVTPFHGNSENDLGRRIDSKVDYPSLEKCLRLQAANNNGIILLGSTGEGLSLTHKERRRIVTFACSLNLNAPIMVGVPSYAHHDALEWLAFCNELPIQGYLMATPIYTKPGIFGQIAWFEALLNASHFPVMLYNIPSRAGVRLYPEVVAALKDHDRFVAIKDSGGSDQQAAKVTEDYRVAAPNVAIFCGDDDRIPEMTFMESVGLVSVLSNVWPKAIRKYVTYSLKGGRSQMWRDACSALSSAGTNPIPIKALMYAAGLIAYGGVRIPLSSKDLSLRQALLAYHELMVDWSQEMEPKNDA